MSPDVPRHSVVAKLSRGFIRTDYRVSFPSMKSSAGQAAVFVFFSRAELWSPQFPGNWVIWILRPFRPQRQDTVVEIKGVSRPLKTHDCATIQMPFTKDSFRNGYFNKTKRSHKETTGNVRISEGQDY